MGNYVKAAAAKDLPEGGKQRVKVEGQDIMLVRVGEHYYAVAGRCPHLGGNLAAGQLDGTVITCPLHGSRFDIRDGRVIRWTKGAGLMTALSKVLRPARRLKVYNVRVDGGDILVEL